MKINLFHLDISAVACLLFLSFFVSSQAVHIGLTISALALWVLLAEGRVLHVLQLWLNHKARSAERSRMM